MKEILTDELKNIQLEILKDIHNHCINNNIRYSLAFGTLLGAIRHNGYIPWDDDIDIMLPREDYNKFINTYRCSQYEVMSLDNNKRYSIPFAKVYDNRTIISESVEIDTNYGVYVDVFPIDYFSDNKIKLIAFLLLKKIANIVYNIKIVSRNHNRNILKNTILNVGHIVLYPISARFLAVCINKLVSSFSVANGCFAGVLMPTDNKIKSIFKSEIFDSFIDVYFEGETFKAISNYDAYMSIWYGNYMQLPPKEKQITHHAFKAQWK